MLSISVTRGEQISPCPGAGGKQMKSTRCGKARSGTAVVALPKARRKSSGAVAAGASSLRRLSPAPCSRAGQGRRARAPVPPRVARLLERSSGPEHSLHAEPAQGERLEQRPHNRV